MQEFFFIVLYAANDGFKLTKQLTYSVCSVVNKIYFYCVQKAEL